MKALILGLLLGTAHAAEVPYTFEEWIPPKRASFVSVEDINSWAVLISYRDAAGAWWSEVVPLDAKRRNIPKPFTCDGLLWSLDENGDRAGTCYEPSMGKSVSVVVHANGAKTVLDPPGSNGGGSWAGSIRNGKVVGQFWGPVLNNGIGAMAYRFHCWTWSLKEGYRQIDFPQPSTFVSCPSINKRGQVLGEYIIVDSQNNYLRHSWFIYDNGIVDVDFPLSEGHLGKTDFYLVDLDDDGAAIGHFWNTLTPRLVLVDDGILFDIPTPAGWLSPAPIGANAEGDFVGRYYVQTGYDTYYQWPIYSLRYFIARQEKTVPRGPK